MPPLSRCVPSYRLHRASGQAVVSIQGKDYYLGPWKSRASRFEYDRLIGEWLVAGRPAYSAQSAAPLTVVELARSYWRFAKTYYLRDGKPCRDYLASIKTSLRFLRRQYG